MNKKIENVATVERERERELYFKENVGVDAFVRPQKEKEKNNRAGRRGRRPLQMAECNLGITLIALIITIIVLLILAGVTLNMLMGENGIIEKAQLAKTKTNESQEQEMENLKNLENEVTTRTGEGYTKLQSTILYPNGTKENPAVITAGQRIEIENPYKGHNVYTVAQIYYNNVWGETGFIYGNGAGGIKATQIQGEDNDKIVVQAGSACVMTWSISAGNGFDHNNSNVTSAPFRVKVFCLD